MNLQQRRMYINDFLYFVIVPDLESDGNDFICYSGVNVDRFTPITKGRHNPMSNCAVRGLQLIQYDIMALALRDGTAAKPVSGFKMEGLPPTNEVWSTETLLIKDAPASLPDRIIQHSVVELLKKIDKAGTRESRLPDELLSPAELQLFLESLCYEYLTQRSYLPIKNSRPTCFDVSG